MLPNEVSGINNLDEIIKSELVVRAVAELDDSVIIELEKSDPEKEVAKAMLEG